MSQRSARADARDLRERNEGRCLRLLEKSALLESDDLAWDRVGEHELSTGDLATLCYMRDVEGFTPSYLSGIGSHRTTLSDPIVSAFLDVWQYEEVAHADALDRYLTTYAANRGVDVPERQVAPERDVPVTERVVARTGGTVGTVVAAAHMTWGAANELLTMNGYRVLADATPDPMLAELLRRIANQESRHYAFYLMQAEWRLASSRVARMGLRRVMRSSWTPVGIGEGYKTSAEFDEVLTHLDANGATDAILGRMDRTIAALPGLGSLSIFSSLTT